MLKHKKSWTDKHTRIVQLVTVVGLIGVAALGTYSIHSSRADGPVTLTASDMGTDNSCVFSDPNVVPAFCDGFNSPQNGGTQTGDLDPTLWGVSRLGNINIFQGGMLNSVSPSHNACAGGGVDSSGNTYGPETPVPADVRICNGQMAESLNDDHGVVNLDSYPKQPFDFAGRTGTVVFDLSMNSDGTHGAWPEFIITDEPVPGARFSVSGGVPAHAMNEVGITFDGCGGGCVGRVYLSKNGVYSLAAGSADLANDKIDSTAVLVNDGSVKESVATPTPGMVLNHVEVRVNLNSLEVWASDPGGANFKKIAHVSNLGLTFTRGLVWMSDTHYNARKAVEPCECGTQYDHTFLWDNLGFDGPKTYRDLGYDVPYANIQGGQGANGDPATIEGYRMGSGEPSSFTLNEVSWSQTPTKAKVVLNVATYDDGASLSVSLNGHAAVTKPISSWEMHAISFDFPTTDAVQGTNTLKFTSNGGLMLITNISLIMVAGAPVPGQTIPPAPPPPNPPPGDTTPPTVSFNFTGFSTQPVDNAVVTDKRTVSMTINSSDASGIASTTATINGSPTTITNNSITTPNANGNYLISVTVKDPSNNTTVKTQTILIRHRDFSRNGVVDLLDLSQLLKAWNTASDVYDFNNTTTTKLVDLFDLSFLMQQWGSSQ